MSMRAMGEARDYFEVAGVDHVRFILERFKARVYFDQSVLRTMELTAFQDIARDSLAYQLSIMVAAWRNERILQVPANWWEHFKQRWFPKWALKRWPVLFVTYDAVTYLPQVPIPDPKMGAVEFAVLRRRES